MALANQQVKFLFVKELNITFITILYNYMGRKFYTVSSELISKLEKTCVSTKDILNNKDVRFTNFYEDFFAELAFGFNNFGRDYDLNICSDVREFLIEYEKAAASDSLLDITLKKALNNINEKCKKNNWRLNIIFDEPIFNIAAIGINLRDIATHDIMIISTHGANLAIGLPLQIGDLDNNTLIVF